ncbi:MAG: hypothetical protein ACTSQF_15645, partial [Candidatus Heimdallarchaeaceae archaeon]
GNELNSELTIPDLDWVACDIIKDSILTEFDPLSSGGYSLEQSPSSIHILETTGIYDRYYGAYTTFPTITGVFSINFEAKVKASFPEAVNLAMSVYDNQTKLINKHIGLVGRGEAIYVTDSLETPYFSSNSTFVMEGVTEVLIFFFLSDSWVADWDQECWIQNLVITTDIDESSLLNERSTEIISSPGPNLSGLLWKDSKIFCGVGVRNISDIVEMNPSTEEIITEHRATRRHDITFDGTYFWGSASSPTVDWIQKYDSSFSTVEKLYLSFTDTSGIASDGSNLWVGNHVTDMIYKINPTSGSTLLSIPGPGIRTRGMQYHGGYLWVVDSETQQFYKLSPADGNIIETYDSAFPNPVGITVDDDGYIWLSSHSCNLIFKTNVNANSDTISPVITSSIDLEYELGSSNNYISWILVDWNPDTYEIYRDGIKQIGPIIWTDGQNITINVDLLPVGTYNYTIIAKDIQGNEASNTIWVTVLEEIGPIITSSGNLEYIVGTTSNYVSWVIESENADTFEIYRESILLTSGLWLESENISINVDYLPVGTYNYTLIAEDLYGYITADTIWVIVVIVEESNFFWYSVIILLALPLFRKRRK